MKERIDVLLVEKGFFDSREKAKRAIMAGIVRDDYDIIDKPGTKIDVESNLYVKGDVMPYVSRGGLKLEKAIKLFDISFQDKIVVDIGSSTGGFTDCSLQHGASLVYAIDVGTNQLAWKLRNNSQVIVKEQTNFRIVTKDFFEQGLPNIATIDVSFISLKHIFLPLQGILEKGSIVIALIKPQFEAGRDDVGKKGIIKDKAIHQSTIEKVIEYGKEHDLILEGLSFSPITGGQGNIEFIAKFVMNGNSTNIDVESVVRDAHNELKQ